MAKVYHIFLLHSTQTRYTLPMDHGVVAGVILNGIVCGIVASVALAFVTFLWRRWDRLPLPLHAYAFIWVMTVIVWTGVSVRYFVMGLGFSYSNIFPGNEIIIESAVFFTAPPLYYYLGLRIFHSQNVARVLTGLSTIISCVAIWFLFQPGGITFPVITEFSAEATLNMTSLIIFTVLAGAACILLAYDTVARLRRPRNKEFSMAKTLYSGSILLYVLLGSIDQSKVFIDWPILAFHILYCAVFLFGYILISGEEARREDYLLPSSSISQTHQAS